MNTVTEMEMLDGSRVSMTLNFAKLYKLRAKDKKTYDTYMKITNNGVKDEMDVALSLYAAYACANLDSEGILPLESFLEILPVSREEVMEAYLALMPKKKAGSR